MRDAQRRRARNRARCSTAPSAPRSPSPPSPISATECLSPSFLFFSLLAFLPTSRALLFLSIFSLVSAEHNPSPLPLCNSLSVVVSPTTAAPFLCPSLFLLSITKIERRRHCFLLLPPFGHESSTPPRPPLLSLSLPLRYALSPSPLPIVDATAASVLPSLLPFFLPSTARLFLFIFSFVSVEHRRRPPLRRSHYARLHRIDALSLLSLSSLFPSSPPSSLTTRHSSSPPPFPLSIVVIADDHCPTRFLPPFLAHHRSRRRSPPPPFPLLPFGSSTVCKLP